MEKERGKEKQKEEEEEVNQHSWVKWHTRPHTTHTLSCCCCLLLLFLFLLCPPCPAAAAANTCRPWDVDRDGFVMGEGAGVFVFESLEHAEKRGATILAEYLGGAVTCDAHHMTDPRSDGLGVSTCIELALKDAGISKEQVNYINAHATRCVCAHTRGGYGGVVWEGGGGVWEGEREGWQVWELHPWCRRQSVKDCFHVMLESLPFGCMMLWR